MADGIVFPSLRVLLVTTSFPLHGDSVSGIFIKRLAVSLAQDMEVTVLTPDDASGENKKNEVSYKLIRFRYAPRSWQLLAHGHGGIMASLAQKKAVRLLLPIFSFAAFMSTCRYARKVDILHANWSINGVLAGLAGFLAGKPVVTTLRGSDVNLMNGSWLFRQMVRLCLTLSKRVVIVSQSLKLALVQCYPQCRDKISVIPNGIDASFFMERKQNNRQSVAVRLLFVGNLTINKGLQVVLDALTLLTRKSWQLDVVGDGPERRGLEELAQVRFGRHKVFFHGPVAPEQIPQYMLGADIFLFASFAEGRPNVLLEAMAAGLPVVAGAIPAVLELIRDQETGLLYPPGDAKEMAAAMDRCMQNAQWAQAMGDRARREIIGQGLTWEKTAGQYRKVYEMCLDGGKV